MFVFVLICFVLLISYFHYFLTGGGGGGGLDRLAWRHDSILNFIAKSLQPVINVHSSLYADVNGFLNTSITTGENYRPDLPFVIPSKCQYVLGLTIGFKSNLNNNAVR